MFRTTIEQTAPNMQCARPHYCLAAGEFVGLQVEATGLPVLFSWCGVPVPQPEPHHRYNGTIRPENYEGPRCEHGYLDVRCVDLYDTDEWARVQLVSPAIREYRAAELARRYGFAPNVREWVRPCRRCRQAYAAAHRAVLQYELEEIARALADENKAADGQVKRLREHLRWLHEAFFELDESTKQAPAEPERRGFVYLIGHDRSVKIGWSEKHPARGRLGQLRTSSNEPLEIVGLIEGPRSLERELHRRFAPYRQNGEWFAPHEDIIAYFNEHGIGA